MFMITKPVAKFAGKHLSESFFKTYTGLVFSGLLKDDDRKDPSSLKSVTDIL